MQHRTRLREALHNKRIVCGALMVGALLLLALVGLFWTPCDPYEMSGEKLDFFSSAHLLGTDSFGRDILSRLMVGVRESFLVGASAVLIGLTVGGLLGLFSGYFGGWVDAVVCKLIEVQMAFPGVLLALMLIAVMGNGLANTMLALGLMAIPRFARITRSGALRCRNAEFVKAVRARGAGSMRILFLHILPQLLPELAVTVSLSFAGAVMSEAGLSYLGLGLPPPTPSLGLMLNEAQGSMLQAGWFALIPAAVLTMLVMGFHLLGDGIQEVTRHE